MVGNRKENLGCRLLHIGHETGQFTSVSDLEDVCVFEIDFCYEYVASKLQMHNTHCTKHNLSVQ